MATSLSVSTPSTTRIVNRRRLWLVRAIWGIAMLVFIAVWAVGFAQLWQDLHSGTILNSIYIERDGDHILVTANDYGSVKDMIQPDETLIAVDGVTLPPETRESDLLRQFRGEIGSTVTLTLRPKEGAVHTIPLVRQIAYFPLALTQVLRLPVSAAVVYMLVYEFILIGIVLIVSVLVVLRRSDDWLALLVVLTLVGWVQFQSNSFNDLMSTYYDSPMQGWLVVLGVIIYFVTYFGLLLFPDGRFKPRWLLALILFMCLISLVAPFAPDNSVAILNAIGGFLVLFTVRYRYIHIFSAAQRQQVKWVLFGLSFYILNLAIDMLISSLFINHIASSSNFSLLLGWLLNIFQYIGVLSIVSGIALAILRYRLWDVDLVIRRSLVYSAMTVALGAVFLAGLFALQALLEALLPGGQTTLAAILSTGIVILLFNPVRKRVRTLIDRYVYGLRFDLAAVSEAQKPAEIKNQGLLTGKTLGGYQLLGVLRKGGMGEVYQAQGKNGLAAVKILNTGDAELAQRLEREAYALAVLNHPNIVRLYASGESEGIFYIALEFIDGQDLGYLLKSHQKWSWDELHPRLLEIMDALDYAHQHGFVHRDIKPSNIMLRHRADKEDAVLMDFGIAKQQDAHTKLTAPQEVIGTIAYMAPEQIRASAEVDQRADIYSMGIVIFELLTGERPFKGNSGQVLFGHLQKPAPSLDEIDPSIPGHISHAVLRAMEKRPEDRFESAKAFLDALLHQPILLDLDGGLVLQQRASGSAPDSAGVG